MVDTTPYQAQTSPLLPPPLLLLLPQCFRHDGSSFQGLVRFRSFFSPCGVASVFSILEIPTTASPTLPLVQHGTPTPTPTPTAPLPGPNDVIKEDVLPTTAVVEEEDPLDVMLGRWLSVSGDGSDGNSEGGGGGEGVVLS